jgi:hypothetical protein
MTGSWRQMRQTTTPEVRLDHGKAAGSGPAEGYARSLAADGGDRDRISLRRNLQGRRIRSNGPGIRGMSVQDRLGAPSGELIREGTEIWRLWDVSQKSSNVGMIPGGQTESPSLTSV